MIMLFPLSAFVSCMQLARRLAFPTLSPGIVFYNFLSCTLTSLEALHESELIPSPI